MYNCSIRCFIIDRDNILKIHSLAVASIELGVRGESGTIRRNGVELMNKASLLCSTSPMRNYKHDSERGDEACNAFHQMHSKIENDRIKAGPWSRMATTQVPWWGSTIVRDTSGRKEEDDLNENRYSNDEPPVYGKELANYDDLELIRRPSWDCSAIRTTDTLDHDYALKVLGIKRPRQIEPEDTLSSDDSWEEREESMLMLHDEEAAPPEEAFSSLLLEDARPEEEAGLESPGQPQEESEKNFREDSPAKVVPTDEQIESIDALGTTTMTTSGEPIRAKESPTTRQDVEGSIVQAEQDTKTSDIGSLQAGMETLNIKGGEDQKLEPDPLDAKRPRPNPETESANEKALQGKIDGRTFLDQPVEHSESKKKSRTWYVQPDDEETEDDQEGSNIESLLKEMSNKRCPNCPQGGEIWDAFQKLTLAPERDDWDYSCKTLLAEISAIKGTPSKRRSTPAGTPRNNRQSDGAQVV